MALPATVVAAAVAAVAATVAAAATTSAPPPTLATTFLLTDAVETHGARCLDGSPQRVWLQAAAPGSPNATKWSIHHMGGAWCEDLDSCTTRAFGKPGAAGDCYIGSSNESCFATAGARTPGTDPPFAPTMDFRAIPSCNGARWCGGLMMNDPALNPLTYDWNKVLLPYCDGGSFGGDRAGAVPSQLHGGNTHHAAGPVDLYFRGFRNLNAAVDTLAADHGLGNASHVLVSGDSAGGLATYWHASWYAQRLPNAKVVSAPDSGFFYYDAQSFPAWGTKLGWVVSFMNSTAGLNQACVAAQIAADADPLECRWPDLAVAHTPEVPTFVLNSKYDPALLSISEGEGGSAPAAAVNAVGRKVVDRVNQSALVPSSVNAAFLTSCHQHCGQWAQDQVPEPGSAAPADANVTIDGYTAVQALNQWWSEVVDGRDHSGSGGNGGWGMPSRRLWVQEAEYPCKECCTGGQT